jgi:hypothetical protein
MCHGRQRAQCSVRPAAGIPGPLHERFFFVMFQQTWSIEIVVPRAIGHLTTNSSARKWAIVCILPTHFEWREVPVVTAGNSGAVCVSVLMTTGAGKSRHAIAIRSADNVCDVTTPFVSLLWIIGGGVAVNTARRSQNPVDLFPRGQSLGFVWALRGFGEKRRTAKIDAGEKK